MERAQTEPYYVHMKRFILFVLLIYLILGLFSNFNSVLLFTFSYSAEPFIQSDLQMSTIEEIKTNKRPIISKCYINIL